MTHPAVYTLPFTLQLCYKRLGILQRVTKGPKVHISSHDVLQKSYTCEGAAHLRICFWHLLLNFEKPKKSEFWKKKKKKYWTYHDFTHVYRKPQSGKVPETRSDIFFLSFRAIFCHFPPPSLTPQKTKILKKRKKHLEICHHFKLVQQKTIKWCMLTQIWSVTDNFLSF